MCIRRLLTLSASAIAMVHGAASACWEQAAAKAGVSPALLVAIAKAESSMNPKAVNRSHVARTGSYDIGIMQINSGNLKGLRKAGITEAALYEPCVNIDVGATILGEKIARYGMTWNAVGAYNAACTQLKGADCEAARAKYAWRVYRFLYPGQSRGAPGAPARARAVASGVKSAPAQPAARYRVAPAPARSKPQVIPIFFQERLA